MAMEPSVTSEGWPEYPVLLPNGTWIGGCNMPHWFDEGRCGRRAIKGTDICERHQKLARRLNKYLGPVDRMIGRIMSWFR